MTLRPDQAVAWITDTLQSKLEKTRNQAKRVSESLENAIDALASSAAELHSKSEREMQAKRADKSAFKAAKALNHMTDEITDRLKESPKAATITHGTLLSLQDRAEKIHRDISHTRSKWTPEIHPFYLLDMMSLGNSIDKIKRTQIELANFLSGPGNQLKKADEIRSKADELAGYELLIQKADVEIESARARIAATDELINNLEAQARRIMDQPEMRNISAVREHLSQLRLQVIERGFRRLGRPLRKLDAEASRGNVPMQPDLREALSSYLKAPSRTLFEEEDDYPLLRQLFAVLVDAISKGKLSAKKAERKKIVDRYRTVVEQNGLTALQNRGRRMIAQLNSILKEPTISSLTEEHDSIRKRVRALKLEAEQLRRELDRRSGERKRLQIQASTLKSQLEQLIVNLTGRKVEVALSSAKP